MVVNSFGLLIKQEQDTHATEFLYKILGTIMVLCLALTITKKLVFDV